MNDIKIILVLGVFFETCLANLLSLSLLTSCSLVLGMQPRTLCIARQELYQSHNLGFGGALTQTCLVKVL
jgi:hypothetical protein